MKKLFLLLTLFGLTVNSFELETSVVDSHSHLGSSSSHQDHEMTQDALGSKHVSKNNHSPSQSDDKELPCESHCHSHHCSHFFVQTNHRFQPPADLKEYIIGWREFIPEIYLGAPFRPPIS